MKTLNSAFRVIPASLQHKWLAGLCCTLMGLLITSLSFAQSVSISDLKHRLSVQYWQQLAVDPGFDSAAEQFKTADSPPPNLDSDPTMERLASAANTATPFTISITDEQIADLRQRLRMSRLPDQLPDTTWEYGTDKAYLTELLDYWQTQYDWRAQESKLNQLDQYIMEVDDLRLHFIHQRSSNPNAIPLLLLHGWPGSIAEFTGIIGPLTEPSQHGGVAADAFHVVAPSLPGFGFSDIPQTRGFNPEQMAHALAHLMEQLGYDRYGLAGGDWGAIINRHVANNYPERLIGLHTNFILASEPSDESVARELTDEESSKRAARIAYMRNEVGYQQIQGTKPQSLGYGLNDSPAGLAAWIVEKFHGWTDMPQGSDGDLDDYISKDDILTNISIYWFTQTITSSSRIYFENSQTRPAKPMGYIDVPTGAAVFPAEIYVTPKTWAEAAYDIQHWTVMPVGGHFAALEQPELYLGDVRTFFRLFRTP